jgi:hypothetical protein
MKGASTAPGDALGPLPNAPGNPPLQLQLVAPTKQESAAVKHWYLPVTPR